MKLIDIAIRNKVAKQTNDEPYICGNSDYAVNFDFDAEWFMNTYEMYDMIFT